MGEKKKRIEEFMTQVLITKACLVTPKQAICQTGFHLDRTVFHSAS